MNTLENVSSGTHQVSGQHLCARHTGLYARWVQSRLVQLYIEGHWQEGNGRSILCQSLYPSGMFLWPFILPV